MQCLGKLWKMRGNIEIYNLSQQQEGETIWCQNQSYHTTKFFTENNKFYVKNFVV